MKASSALDRVRALAGVLAEKWSALNRHPFARRTPWLLVFCIVLAGLFTLGPRLMDISYKNIDPSYNYAINKATADGLSFGDEFIATYGPLGYLVANYLPQNVTKVSIWLLMYAAALGFGVYLFCRAYIKGSVRPWLAAAGILYALSICKGGGYIEWSYLAVFLLYCFVYLRANAKHRLWLIVGLATVAALFSLMKFTLGVASLLALLVLCGFDFREALRQRIKRVATAGAVYVGVLALFSVYLHVNIIEYARTALLLSGNFGSAMGLYDPETAPATAMVAIVLILLAAWPVWRERKQAIRYAFLLLPLFVVWKYSVGRQDMHIIATVQIAIPVALLLYFSLKKRTQTDVLVVAAAFLLVVMAVWANKIPYKNEFAPTVFAPVESIKTGRFIDFFDISGQKERWAVIAGLQTEQAALPDTMRQAIGTQSVDVFPWEAVAILTNNLQWQNRPSPFSFQSFDPYLDDVNARFFESDKAPQFVLWHHVGASGVQGVDYRHILWDEPRTFQAILSHYEFVEHSDELILLKKREKPLGWQEAKVTKHAADGNIPLSAAGQGFLFAYFETNKTARSALQELLLRGKVHTITVKNTDSSSESYRFVQENSSQGFLVSDLPKDWEGLVALFKDGDLQTGAVQVQIDDNAGGSQVELRLMRLGTE